MESRKIILSSSYFAPIQSYSKYILYKDVIIDGSEKYLKQSYRNRCSILAANGPLDLAVPVVGLKSHRLAIKDIAISYDTDWQRQHLKSIISAYGKSPYFEYYIDDFRPIFEKREKFLLDLNVAIDSLILEILDVDLISTTVKDRGDIKAIEDSSTVDDFRGAISPKMKYRVEDNLFTPMEYKQVFHEKMEFYPNLSSLDLIFNEGPNSLTILNQSINR